MERYHIKHVRHDCTKSIKLNLEFVIYCINLKKPKGTGADDIPTSFVRLSTYCNFFNEVKGFLMKFLEILALKYMTLHGHIRDWTRILQ